MAGGDDVIIVGDTERSPALRHEVPLAIVDPFLYMEVGGRRMILTTHLEQGRIAAAAPDAELLLAAELGFYDLIEAGSSYAEAHLEIVARAVADAGVRRARVPRDLPVAVADRLRADGVVLDVDGAHFDARRRAKSAAELAGIRRAQRAAEAGMAAGRALLRAATIDGDRLLLDGVPLTAERVRAAVRGACADHGAPAPPDVMVTSAWSAGGHDPGSGPLPARLPIEIDLWPRDEESGCWADMTRTVVVGEVPPRVAELHAAAREALAAARAAVRPGRPCRDLYDAAAEVIERVGEPTLRTRDPGASLDRGFCFALGHGVGLEVHEDPVLGLSAGAALVEGDVLALEPGVEGVPGLGGVRVEDLVLVTAGGVETLTDAPDDLAP